MLTGACNDVKQTTVVSCFCKAGLEVAPDKRCSDDGAECLDNECQTLSAFSGTIPDGPTAHFSADDDVQAVVDRNDAEIVVDICDVEEEPDSSSDSDMHTQPPTAAQLASAFSVLHR